MQLTDVLAHNNGIATPKTRRKCEFICIFVILTPTLVRWNMFPEQYLEVKYDDLWGWRGPLRAPEYPVAELFDRKFPASGRVMCTGPAGTLVFCDTFGFHRGGISTSSSRLLATWQFVTPASLHVKRYNVDWRHSDAGRLSPEQLFAIK